MVFKHTVMNVSGPFHGFFAKYIFVLILLSSTVYLILKCPGLDLHPLFFIVLTYSIFRSSAWVSFLVVLVSSFYPLIFATDYQELSVELLTSMALRFLLLLISLLVISNYLSVFRKLRQRLSFLQTIIPQCPECGSLLCADGRWVDFDKLILDPSLFGSLPVHDCRSNDKSS